jgi:hypothetical protein
MIIALKKTALAALLGMGFMVGQLQAATVDWGAEGGANSFAEASISFTGFNADTLSGVSNSNANVSTNNGSLYPIAFTLDILLDNVWTNIFSVTSTGTYFVQNIPSTSFTYGEVTGLRAKGTGFDPVGNPNPMKNWALGTGFSSPVFTFAALNPPSSIPLPAGLPLLLAGLACLGLVRWRQRPAL